MKKIRTMYNIVPIFGTSIRENEEAKYFRDYIVYPTVIAYNAFRRSHPHLFYFPSKQFRL